MTNKTSHTTAKDFFLHLLWISMLYTSMISLITLLFQYIDVKFPDALDFHYISSLEIIRNSMATLIVVWPVYLIVSHFIRKDMAKSPEKAGMWVRKWLMYLTLFVSSITIIVDLVILINNFLGGELTTRFGLKVLAILAIAVCVFWYHLWDLKTEGAINSKAPRNIASISSITIVLIIIGGFFLVGTPSKQRELRFDDQRVEDLSIIQYEILNYWQTKRELPENLESLSNELTGYVLQNDPETDLPYEYQIISDLQFELCATFTHESYDHGMNKDYESRADYPMRGYMQTEYFNHSAGRECFTRTIDPELYPEDEIN